MEFNDRALPFKLTNMTKGAQKAYRNFISFYGFQEGRRIYLKKADEQGTGNTIREKVNSTYKKGAKLKKEGE